MAGGLLQLVTTGVQDSPIIGNPEITFFKTVYKQHTNFSLYQGNRYLGKSEFNKSYNKVIEKSGDLLYNQYFKLDIPFFEIIKKIPNTKITDLGYNINQLETMYANLHCYVIYYQNNWYIIPENLFGLSEFEKILYNVNSTLLENGLLPEYIKQASIGEYAKYYQIKQNEISSIINILRISSNFWEQFWLDIISKFDDIKYINALITLQSEYNATYLRVKNYIYDFYANRNFTAKNIESFYIPFETNEINKSTGNKIQKIEITRYYEYLNSLNEIIKGYDGTNNLEEFDIDMVFTYCQNNFLNFEEYRDNVLPFNSLVILLTLLLLYSDSSYIYNFWKKYPISDITGVISTNPTNNLNTSTNQINEWPDNINSIISQIIKKNDLKNPAFENIKKKYNETQNAISDLFTNTTFNDPKNIYINLKIIFNRFFSIPNNQLNFNDFYYGPKYGTNLVSEYNSNNFNYIKDNFIFENLKINNLTVQTEENEIENLTPADIQNIFIIIADNIISSIFDIDYIDTLLSSFLKLWKNSILSRLFKRFLQTYFISTNNFELFDKASDRKLTLYYSIFPSNLYTFSDFKKSFFEMFYKNSFVGSWSISNSMFEKIKENLFQINKTTLLDLTDYTSNNNHYKLTINNIYEYTYNDYSKTNNTINIDDLTLYQLPNDEILDNIGKYNSIKVFYKEILESGNINKKFYIKFDNYFDENCNLVLYVNNTNIPYDNVKFVHKLNEYNYNSIYLEISKLQFPDNFVLNNNSIIKLDITYTNYLPIVLFNEDNYYYNQVTNKKYYLLTKFTDNKPNINNFIDTTQVRVNDYFANSTKIKFLCLIFNTLQKLIKPEEPIAETITSSYNSVTPGNHWYMISYFNLTEESEFSEKIKVNVGGTQNVRLNFIPNPNNSIGINIYRTKANDTKFYLLNKINNNSESVFIDDKPDDELGIEYNIDSNIKYNQLPLIYNQVIKVPIKIESRDDYYVMIRYDTQEPFELEYTIDDFKEIYIEELDIDYQYIDYQRNNNIIIFVNSEDFNKDYYYYLSNSWNLNDYCPLSVSKKNVPFLEEPIKLELSTDSSVLNGIYKYKIAFWNSNTDQESLPSDFIEINCDDKAVIISDFSPIIDSNFTNIKIYRTKSNGDTFYFLDIKNENINTYIDVIQDEELLDEYKEPVLYITKPINTENTYLLMKIKQKDWVPNLYSFISHSTDDFANDKGLSDMGDYQFNKPFIMLINNTNINTFGTNADFLDFYHSDNCTNLYFYNVNFKINPTSFITLDNYIVNFILPISTQQFFIKNDEEIYYKINFNNNIYEEASNTEILSSTFSPAFDIINIYDTQIQDHYDDIYIDQISNKLNEIINNNPDFSTATNLIEESTNIFIKSITSLLNRNLPYFIANKRVPPDETLYGKTSFDILTKINTKLNRIDEGFNDRHELYNIVNDTNMTLYNYLNSDFFKYSHYALDLSIDPLTINRELSTITPVFERYDSFIKISYSLYQFLLDMSEFYKQHISYINKNEDYLNISNPNNYNESFLSNKEILQDKLNNFYDYSGKNTIDLLHPIVDDNLEKIRITYNNNTSDVYSDNFNIINNQIIINNDSFTNNIQKEEFTDAQLVEKNRHDFNDDKFNYLGILSILNNDYVFNDPYIEQTNDKFFLMDNNKIFKGYAISEGNNIGRLEFTDSDNNDILTINPFEIEFGTNTETLQFNQIDKYIYVIKFKYGDSSNKPLSGSTNFIMDNFLFYGYYETNDDYDYLTIISNQLINFNGHYLFYQEINNNNTTWKSSSKIIEYNVELFKYVNYKSDTIFDYDILKYENNCIIKEDVVNFSFDDENIDGSYLYIDSTNNNIIVNCYNLTESENPDLNEFIKIQKPTMLIINKIAYSYYYKFDFTKKIRETEQDNYVMLFDSLNNNIYISQIENIKTIIPQGNYHCWLYPNNYIKRNSYKVNIHIDEDGNLSNIANIPEYSFYLIEHNNLSCIYYYQNGTTIDINSGNYYTITNTDIDTIYLLDCDIFDTQMKQRLKLSTTINATENYINKKLIYENDGTVLKANINKLIYESEFSRDILDINSNNTYDIILSGDKEVIVDMILNYNDITIYHPIVLRTFEIINKIPAIEFEYNSSIFTKSFIPINSTSLSNTLTFDLKIGKIKFINENSGEDISLYTFNTTSPYIFIDENYDVYLKSGFIINDLSFNMNLWKILITFNNNDYYMYFWTLLTDNTDLIDAYINLLSDTINKIGIYEPYYIEKENLVNYGLNHQLISCNPNILEQDGNNFDINVGTNTKTLVYSYHANTRHSKDTIEYELKKMNSHHILNIKPVIETLFHNEIAEIIDINNKLNDMVAFYILSWTDFFTEENKFDIILGSNSSEIYNIDTTYMKNLSVYFSLNYPTYIYNPITLVNANNDLFLITKYDKLYLEIGEIILLDGNYFLVNGLNTFNEHYELTLIKFTKQTRYKYRGYYSLGNYIRKDNRIIPELKYQNLLTLNKESYVELGELYLDSDKKIRISSIAETKNMIYKFDDKPLKVKLFYNNGKLYLFDDFVKIKKMDILIYQDIDENIYEYQVIDIRDGELILNHTFYNLIDNVFVDLILPYQPFKYDYINFDSTGKILSTTLKDNTNLIFNLVSDTILAVNNGSIDDEIIQNSYIFDNDLLYFGTINGWEQVLTGLYKILSDNLTYNDKYVNIINGELFIVLEEELSTLEYYKIYNVFNNQIIVGTNFTAGYKWVRILDTTYKSWFENNFTLPTSFTNTNIKNDFPIELKVSYQSTENKLKIINVLNSVDKDIVDVIQFYHMQPVRIAGSYNYINKIIKDDDNYYIYLINELKINNSFNNTELKLCLTPTFINNVEHFSDIKFRYNFAIQSYDYTKFTNGYKMNVTRYVLKNDDLIFIENKINNNNIVFEYGKSITENENDNNIHNNREYISLYFYNYLYIEEDGTIKNLDFEFGKYYLLIEKQDDIIKVNLAKFIYPGKLKFYRITPPKKMVLGNILNLSLGMDQNFSYYNPQIIQVNKLPYINQNKVELIKKYLVRLIGLPQIIDNQFKYEIEFLDNVIDINIYNQVYLTESCDVPYTINFIDNKYYITIDKLLNDTKYLYTLNTNWLVSATKEQQTKKDKKLDDPKIEPYIKENIRDKELLYFSVYLSKMNLQENNYYYKILDNTYNFVLNPYETYRISTFNQFIESINNSINTISTKSPIEGVDPDLLEVNNDFKLNDIYLENNINLDIAFNNTNLFSDTKLLKNKLLLQSQTNKEYIYNGIKPWNYWSLLNSIQKVIDLEQLTYIGYYQWNIEQITANEASTNPGSDIYWIDTNPGINQYKLKKGNTLVSGKYQVLTNSTSRPQNGLFWINNMVYNITDGIPYEYTLPKIKLTIAYCIEATEKPDEVSYWFDSNDGYKLKKGDELQTGDFSILTDSTATAINGIQWGNNKYYKVIDGIPIINFSYITNEESTIISKFLISINTNETAKENYLLMKDEIQPLILNNLSIWLNNPTFYFNIQEQINNFLKYNGYDAYFDGNNIIFNNDKPVYYELNGQKEVANYISDEFTWDSDYNIVYRDNISYNKINDIVGKWINKETNNDTFGINIHKLCRYLYNLGEDMKKLYFNFNNKLNDTPIYDYNSPLKFMINYIWEKYYDIPYLNMLDKEFTDLLAIEYDDYSIQKNIYSSINYMYGLALTYSGTSSNVYFEKLGYDQSFEYIIGNLRIYNPTLSYYINPNFRLITQPLFPYTVNFESNEITPNVKYSVDFLNGTNISTDINIESPNIYPDQIDFYSTYNLQPSDFAIIKQNNIYDIIKSEFLGNIFQIEFNIDCLLVDKVKFRNKELVIGKKNSNNMILMIPLTDLNITNIDTNDVFEFINNVGIVSIVKSNDRYYLEFYNYNFNFIENKTILQTSNNIYILYKDVDKYYIIGSNPNTYDATIINMLTPTTIENLNEVAYSYSTSPEINEIKYKKDYINFVNNLDIRIYSSENNIKITPISIDTLGDNLLILYYSIDDYNNYISINNWDKIYYNKKLSHNLTNEIIELTDQIDSEYIYYFKSNLPKTTNTTVYIYDNNDIDIFNGIFEPINDPENKTSIYFEQLDNQTNFTLRKLYTQQDLTDNYRFIQKNEWVIKNYYFYEDKMYIEIPLDLEVLDEGLYHYKFNNEVIYASDFIIIDGLLAFPWSNELNGDIIFQQYYIANEKGVVFKPPLNKKCLIQLGYSYQYTPSDRFYIIPYTGNGNEFDEYLYLLKSNIASEPVDFSNAVNEENIYLYANGVKYNGKVFYKYFDEFVYYLISLPNNNIDENLIYDFHLDDNINYQGTIQFYQNALQFANFYKQNDSNYIELFMNENINNYQVYESSTIKPSKYYLVSYTSYQVINKFSQNQFVQMDSMKRKYSKTNEYTKLTEAPQWKDFSKFLSYIRLYFNDQLIDEINEDIFNFNYYLYSNDERKKQISNMSKIRKSSEGWSFYLHIPFWYAGKPGLSIPLVALPHTEVRLEYKFNELVNIVDNNLVGEISFSKTPEIKVSLITDNILLDSIERKLFGSFAHEYVVEINKIYPDNYISQVDDVIEQKITGLVKDILFTTKPINYPNYRFYPTIVNKYDKRYERYVKSVEYYNEFIKNGSIYTSIEQKDYAIEIQIIKDNTELYNLYLITNNKDVIIFQDINQLINSFSHYRSDDYFIKFLMFLRSRYNMSDKVIATYLEKMYSDKQEIIEESPIESMVIRVNGTELLAERDWLYYNSVVPYQKFKNTLPTGYYVYSFSLYPLENQHSGHLNFTHFDENVFKIKSNERVNESRYKMSIITKEYNILRIMSGHGSLGWI
jgi:hypothetical protein